MSALSSLTEVFGEGGHGDNSERFAAELLAEHRAVVLREAADAFVAEVQQWQREPRWRDGRGDSRGPGVLHAIEGLRRMVDEAGKDTRGGSQPREGESTQPARDLHGVIYDTLVRTAEVTGLKHAQIRQHLAEHLLKALAPLVRYREVWDSALPPGGMVCSVCGQPVESEPCTEHAPKAGAPAPGDRRERYAEALYNTLEVSPTRTPWTGLSPLRRVVWYARADAAMAVADAELDPVYRSGYRTGRMHAGGESTQPADFFQPSRLYQHPSEGLFLVTYVGTAPAEFEYHAETVGVAFGWRRGLSPNGVVEGLGSYTTPDFHGWEPLEDRHETPYGCLWCGDAKHHHGTQHAPGIGLHQWVRPTAEQVKARMLARRQGREGESTEPAELTIYRASHESIVFGHYTTREAAREHCQTLMRRENPALTLEWRPDGEWREDDDGEPGPDEAEELYAYGTHEDSTWDPTGYVVTPLTVASAYDEEADE